MSQLNVTHDPTLKSWVTSANAAECDFPIQNLPYGVFSTKDRAARIGVALGDRIVDLAVLEQAGLLRPSPSGAVFSKASLNDFMALGRPTWSSTRARLSALLADGGDRALRDDVGLMTRALVPLADATMQMPITVRGYTDFYASKEHATNVGAMFRDPKNALLPNWVHIPIGYNGRASTVVVSGTPVRRPLGQIKPPNSEAPVFSPCRKLDFELEMAAIVGRANPMGETLSVDAARDAIFGFVLLNDWSARDIQAWEYVPLGPFQAKAFATSISPWVVTSEALEPFRVTGPSQSPEPLPYLRQSKPSNYDVSLEVTLQVQGLPAPTRICRTNFKHMYWSSAQQLAHHAICGCAMEIGDLLGSGTISGASKDSLGSLLELTWNGANPLTLDDGATRTFIEDGDEVIMSGWCQGQSYRIGFGAVRGSILPAHDVSQ